MTTRKLLVSTAAAAVLVLSALAPGASAQQYPPGTDAECIRTLDAAGNPTVVFAPGDGIIVEGSAPGPARCFTPGAIVTITLSSDPVVLGRTRADTNGDYTTRGLGMRIPEGTSPGTHTVSATGRLDGRDVTYSQAIRVLPGAAVGVRLPATGRDLALLVGWGVLLVAAGSALIALTWRKWRTARYEALLEAEGAIAPPLLPPSEAYAQAPNVNPPGASARQR